VRTATIKISRDDEQVLSEAASAFAKAWRTGKSGGDSFTFSSPAQLFTVLPPKRWDLIERLQALGPSSLRGLGRALGRDVKRLHEDVAVLLEWGFVARDDAGKLFVPYDVIHADFDLRAAA
jgi:predicted transcriptional regulator